MTWEFEKHNTPPQWMILREGHSGLYPMSGYWIEVLFSEDKKDGYGRIGSYERPDDGALPHPKNWIFA